jgi:hypothetical protein
VNRVGEEESEGALEYRPNRLCIDAVDSEMSLREILVPAVIPGNGYDETARRAGCHRTMTAVLQNQKLLRKQLERLRRLKINVWGWFATSYLVATDQKLKKVENPCQGKRLRGKRTSTAGSNAPPNAFAIQPF